MTRKHNSSSFNISSSIVWKILLFGMLLADYLMLKLQMDIRKMIERQKQMADMISQNFNNYLKIYQRYIISI